MVSQAGYNVVDESVGRSWKHGDPLPGVDFQPMGNWNLVMLVDGAIVGRSGLYLPTQAHGQTLRRGVVVVAGTGTIYGSGTFVKNPLKRGDYIFFGKAAQIEINLEEGCFLLLRENEVFGTIPSMFSKEQSIIAG
jgi:co-chaperonin GroES (HSP10)